EGNGRRALLEDLERAGAHAAVETPPGQAALGDRELHPHPQEEVTLESFSRRLAGSVGEAFVSPCDSPPSPSGATRFAFSRSRRVPARPGSSSIRIRRSRGWARG